MQTTIRTTKPTAPIVAHVSPNNKVWCLACVSPSEVNVPAHTADSAWFPIRGDHKWVKRGLHCDGCQHIITSEG